MIRNPFRLEIFAKMAIFFVPFVNYGQNGINCSNAINITPSFTCSFAQFQSVGLETWFKFTATSENVKITVESVKFGINSPHIHNLSIYEGTCVNNQLKIEDDLPFIDSADRISLDVIAYGLQIGNEYYFKTNRLPHSGTCNKTNCKINGSTGPATFKICVENIFVVIPQSSGELPSLTRSYEENKGQVVDINGNTSDEVLFFDTKESPSLYLTSNYASFVWSKIDTVALTNDTIHRIDLKMVKSQFSKIYTSQQKDHFNNYYLGHTPNGLLRARSFSRILYSDIYPSIDMQYYSSENGLKLYYIIRPGGNPNDIKISFEGATSTAITASNGLIISSVLGSIKFQKADVIGVDINGNTYPLTNSGSFVSNVSNIYNIEIEPYPSNLYLIISVDQDPDPQPLTGPEDLEWSTYFGGTLGSDGAVDLTSDNNGNIFVVGYTGSFAFPSNGAGVFNASLNGYIDGFLSKFSPDYELLWSTYYGGDKQDYGKGIARDNNNNVTYISGGSDNSISTQPYSTQMFLSNPNAYVDSYNAGIRTFFSRFDDQGAREWSTYFVNNFDELIASKLLVDAFGNLYACGSASMINGQIGVYSNLPQANGNHPICFPSSNSYHQFYNGSVSDAFIAKFNNNLELVWSTFLGGSSTDQAQNITIDNSNNLLYVVGVTNSDPAATYCMSNNTSGGFPLCNNIGYFQNTRANQDGFISRFNFDGEIHWSTYFGGNGSEWIYGVDVNESGNVYITGNTDTQQYGSNSCVSNTDGGFPNCNPVGSFFQNNQGGGSTSDAFIAQFRSTTNLIWSTFIGGLGTDGIGFGYTDGPKVNINTNGYIHIFGSTKSGSNSNLGIFPTLSDPNYYFKNTHADYTTGTSSEFDTYIVTFTPDRQMSWSTYFGGKGTSTGDRSGGILGLGDRVYICGTTSSNLNFPYNCPNTLNPYCQSTLAGGGTDGFIAQLRIEGSSLGIEDQNSFIISNEGLLIYPNPNSGNFTVQWNSLSAENSRIRIFNQLGQTIQSIEVKTLIGLNNYEISHLRLSAGVYFLELSDENTLKSVKIVVN